MWDRTVIGCVEERPSKTDNDVTVFDGTASTGSLREGAKRPSAGWRGCPVEIRPLRMPRIPIASFADVGSLRFVTQAASGHFRIAPTS